MDTGSIPPLPATPSDHEGSAHIGAPVDKFISESETEAEYTIGWVRIGLGLALFASGLLVSSSMSSFGEERFVHQSMITALASVGAFLFLGIASLVLVARDWFRPWMAFALVAGDALILALNLQTNLEGHGLGGNWIAAMPVIWVAPLVLAVGALRYRPSVQVWITTVLMLALVGIGHALGFRSFLPEDLAASSGDFQETIARLFSLPPYLMRAVMLALVGLTTALVMVRSRRLLLRAVNETARRANLARFLPAEIAPLVQEEGLTSWRQGRRQQAAILFVDIRGSTALAENLDPARLSIFISSFRRRVMRAVEAHHGVVDKFIGDGALVVFGVPESRHDDSSRAIACARMLLSLMEQWNSKRGFDPPVRVGIGIHTGVVYCGLIGDERRIEFTVLGDVVNVAAKIEQATKRFDKLLLASEAVVRQAGERSAWQEVSREPLGGRGEHMAILTPSSL